MIYSRKLSGISAKQKKCFSYCTKYKKVFSFSESDWIGGIDEIVNKILLNTFSKEFL
jgi:hypothetical protein